MSKVKRPTIDEGKKKVILTRLFGDNYCQHPEKEDMYLGYINDAISEVSFYGTFCSVTEKEDKFGKVKFGNLVTNKFFATRGLRCSTDERIGFDKETCAHVACFRECVSFYFWYRKS